MLYNEFIEKVVYYANKKERVNYNKCSVTYSKYKDLIEPLYLHDTTVNNASEFCKKYCLRFVD